MAWLVNDNIEYTGNTTDSQLAPGGNTLWWVASIDADGDYHISQEDPQSDDYSSATMKIGQMRCEGCFKLVV